MTLGDTQKQLEQVIADLRQVGEITVSTVWPIAKKVVGAVRKVISIATEPLRPNRTRCGMAARWREMAPAMGEWHANDVQQAQNTIPTPYGGAHLVIRTVRRPGTRRAPVSRTSRPAPPRSVRPRPESRARSTPSPGRWRRRAPGGTTPSRHSRTTLTGTTSRRTPSMRSRMCASWWGTSYTAWRSLPARMEMPTRR